MSAKTSPTAKYSKSAGAVMVVLGTLLAGPAFAQEPRLLYPALAAATIADTHSTLQGFSVGLREVHPLTQGLCFGHAGPRCMTAVSVGLAGVVVLGAEGLRAQGKKKSSFWLLVANTAVRGVWAWHNYRQIGLQERRSR